MLCIHNGRVMLRDMNEKDIETLLEWELKPIGPGDYRLFDAPWEYDGLSPEQMARELEKYRDTLEKRLGRTRGLADNEPRSRFIIAPLSEPQRAIGWCSSYFIAPDGEYSAEDTGLTAVGIDILDPEMRGRGYGFYSLKLFIDYLLTNGIERVFTQTWSGNANMISLARRLGFKEIIRKDEIRSVRGSVYDGLTFELDRAAFDALTEPEEELPLKTLKALGIGYKRITHPAADTIELCAGIGSEYGAEHCKNLFLTNRSGSDFHLLMMAGEKPFRTSEVSKKLGVSRLSFASDEQLLRVVGLKPGSVSALGLLNPSAKAAYDGGRLHIAIDEALLERERICVHPNVNTATLVLEVGDLLLLLEKTGYEFKKIRV